MNGALWESKNRLQGKRDKMRTEREHLSVRATRGGKGGKKRNGMRGAPFRTLVSESACKSVSAKPTPQWHRMPTQPFAQGPSTFHQTVQSVRQLRRLQRPEGELSIRHKALGDTQTPQYRNQTLRKHPPTASYTNRTSPTSNLLQKHTNKKNSA